MTLISPSNLLPNLSPGQLTSFLILINIQNRIRVRVGWYNYYLDLLLIKSKYSMLASRTQSAKLREYICPCSKAYLSYAALFTHIKQKHSGKPPGAISKPPPENKRGRPRKQDSDRISKQKETVSEEVKLKIEFPQELFGLKSTPGSHFRSYQADSFQNPTYRVIPLSGSLILDVKNLIGALPSTPIPSKIQDNISLSTWTKHCDSKLADKLTRFLELCSKAAPHMANQIDIFLCLLLEFASSRISQPLQFSHIQESMQPFLENLGAIMKERKLEQFGILREIFRINMLVMLLNWLTREQETAEKQESCKGPQYREENYSSEKLLDFSDERVQQLPNEVDSINQPPS